MGKKTDRMYITATEWKRDFGGKKDIDINSKDSSSRLPLECCSLTFQPFTHPVCTIQGHIFDLEAIVPFIQKYHKNPCTDEPLELSQLIRLKFSRNSETGELQCASTQETFSPNTHVVALKTTGNVYSYDAIETLCLKTKTLRDLLDDSPFTRADIITLQDPHNIVARNPSSFAHIKDDNVAKQVEQVKKGDNASSSSAPSSASSSSSSTMPSSTSSSAPAAAAKPRFRPQLGISLATKPTGAAAAAASLTSGSASGSDVARGLYSSGAVSGSFTSTSMSVATLNERQALTPEQILEQHYSHLRKMKAKGYVRLSTTLGNINLQLDVDMVPRTCHNFLELCERKNYDDTIFHRLIPGFMIQGGDFTHGNGRGGEGAFEKEFKDEFHSNLRHDSRGILAMANSGPNTNGSQFYITFAPTPHLDNKHSVFGRVVGGMDVLDVMEKVECTNSKPVTDIKITAVTIYQNPFKEAFIPKDVLTGKAANEAPPVEQENEMGAWFSNPTAEAIPQPTGSTVEGFKYLALPKPSHIDANGANIDAARKLPSKRKESPNPALDDSQSTPPNPATTRPTATASASTGDTSMTPKAATPGASMTDLDEDALAFEREAARRRAQLATSAAQQTKTTSYGNFGNW